MNSIGLDFNPILEEQLADEWLYVVNFYGQVCIQDILNNYKRVICDNAQAYFQEPLKGVDTLYTCRKFFGVSDGAILYTDKKLENLPIDESHDRMHFLLGRYEKSASEFYNEYVANNDFFEYEPIKLMSRLTNNILHGIDYEYVKNRRTENFTYLNEKLFSVNKLQLKIPQKTDKALHINKEYEKKVNRVLQHISKEEIYELSGLHCSNDVKLLGSLKTIRCICNTFPNVKIALDKSFYFNNIDYEIEIEYVDELSIDIVDRLKMLDLHLDKDVNGKNKRFLSAYKKYN